MHINGTELKYQPKTDTKQCTIALHAPNAKDKSETFKLKQRKRLKKCCTRRMKKDEKRTEKYNNEIVKKSLEKLRCNAINFGI